MICFHHNDLDGRCAAAIVGYACGRPAPGTVNRFVEMDYAKRVPTELIDLNERVYIVDFHFKPNVMADVLARTTDVVWIDHHATAAAYDYGRVIMGVRDFAPKTDKSGALLAWEYFFPTITVPESVRLVCDFDTWTLKLVPKSLEFMEGMRLRDQSPESPIWPLLFADYLGGAEGQNAGILIDEIAKVGAASIAYRDQYCKDIRDNYGFEAEIVGHPGLSCYALNLYRFGSFAYGDAMKKYDVCAGFIFDGSKWTVSFYSLNSDVSVVAKGFGGGGHKGASGCVTDDLGKVLRKKEAK